MVRSGLDICSLDRHVLISQYPVRSVKDLARLLKEDLGKQKAVKALVGRMWPTAQNLGVLNVSQCLYDIIWLYLIGYSVVLPLLL